MKKIFILGIVILIAILALIFIPKKTSKFYLDDEYYNTENRYVVIDNEKLSELVENKKSFVVFTYLPYCTFSVPCDVVFETFLNEHNMSFYSIPYDEFSEVTTFDEIKYAPSVVIVKEGKIVTYLDANSDNDLDMYQDKESFTNWILNYINLKE